MSGEENAPLVTSLRGQLTGYVARVEDLERQLHAAKMMQAQEWPVIATQRLRSVVSALGLQSEVPEGDLTGHEFAVLGVIRRAVERLQAARLPGGAVADLVKYSRLARGIQNPAGQHDDGPWEDFYACDDVVAAIAAQAAPVAASDLKSIDQYRMQMAGISTAALGYWTESDTIAPKYDTPALRDVAKLYAKYAALHAQAAPVAAIPQSIIDAAKAFAQAHIDCDEKEARYDADPDSVTQEESDTADAVYNRTKAALVAAYRATHTQQPAAVPAERPLIDMSNIGQAVSADPIVELNVALLRDRSAVGVGKYGVTLAGNKLPLRAWLAHALEEALDQANYLQRAMQEIDAGGERLAPAGASCTLPPEGWYCTRGAGHSGPCAAHSLAAKGHDDLMADAYSVMLWLLRRLPRHYQNPPQVANVIRAVGRAVGSDASEFLDESEQIETPRPPAGELPVLPALPAGYSKKSDYDPIGGLPLFSGGQMETFGRQSRAAGMEEAAKVCDNADKSAHPSDLAFAIRATIITGSA